MLQPLKIYSVEELEKENRDLKDRLSKVEAILDKE